MPTLEITSEQVLELAMQLPREQEASLFRSMLMRQWPEWEALSRAGAEGARRAAALRGRDWDTMNEGDREQFVVDLVHEDRSCRG